MPFQQEKINTLFNYTSRLKAKIICHLLFPIKQDNGTVFQKKSDRQIMVKVFEDAKSNTIQKNLNIDEIMNEDKITPGEVRWFVYLFYRTLLFFLHLYYYNQ